MSGKTLAKAEAQADATRPGFGDVAEYLCSWCDDTGTWVNGTTCPECPRCRVCKLPIRYRMGQHFCFIPAKDRFCTLECVEVVIDCFNHNSQRVRFLSSLCAEYGWRQSIDSPTFELLVELLGRYVLAFQADMRQRKA